MIIISNLIKSINQSMMIHSTLTHLSLKYLFINRNLEDKGNCWQSFFFDDNKKNQIQTATQLI